MPFKQDLGWSNKLDLLPNTLLVLTTLLVVKFLKEIWGIEIILDDQDHNLLNKQGSSNESWYESVEYTRTLICFFKDGHHHWVMKQTLSAGCYHP